LYIDATQLPLGDAAFWRMRASRHFETTDESPQKSQRQENHTIIQHRPCEGGGATPRDP
jgi:hypothetical protein